MSIFITATGTNVGKTVVSSWLCLHSGYSYFKPIQTGEEIDSEFVHNLTGSKYYPEIYKLKAPLSPHIAAKMEGISIDLANITLPDGKLIVEGAGGVMVPVNEKELMLDVIKKLGLKVIIVASTELGTINHTCLTIAALRSYDIDIIGVITNGKGNKENKEAIEHYGKVKVIAELHWCDTKLNKDWLLSHKCEILDLI